MRAIVISRPGGPEVLEIRDVPLPEPADDEIRVRVRAFALNRADLLQRRGLYPAPPDSPQDIPGLEYAGEIDAIGERAGGVNVGDRVMGICGGGSYAEYLCVHGVQAIPVPDWMSWEQAAALPEAFLTAFDALEQLRVVENEWVLVHAVGSGVGTAAVQLIRARGARCIGTSRTADKLERAMKLGLDAGINTRSDDLVESVRRLTGGKGVAAVIDLIGGPEFSTTLRAMAPRGRLIIVGLTAGNKAELDMSLVLRNRLHIMGTVLRSRGRDEKVALTGAFREHTYTSLAGRQLLPVVDRVFPFNQTAAAHSYMESNANFGKVVVTLP
jgi:putative PIG3 family NAD(P)H quinone oxidoreductase